ncbi:MAG: hypothetical protein KAJ18_08800 [Candidatus Omnitrophica bacterium]|nr:hypothetical protein [Candidatus Omnitrophota bacterium]
MVRLNITLPEDVIECLDKVSNKSRFIAEAVRERFKKDAKDKMNKELIEAYKASAQEDKKTNDEWDNATFMEGWE